MHWGGCWRNESFDALGWLLEERELRCTGVAVGGRRSAELAAAGARGRRRPRHRRRTRAHAPPPPEPPLPPFPPQVAPNCLALCLKRFGLGRFSKINRRVAAGETLDLGPFMAKGAMDRVSASARVRCGRAWVCRVVLYGEESPRREWARGPAALPGMPAKRMPFARSARVRDLESRRASEQRAPTPLARFARSGSHLAARLHTSKHPRAPRNAPSPHPARALPSTRCMLSLFTWTT
jgi:hypothetical protein